MYNVGAISLIMSAFECFALVFEGYYLLGELLIPAFLYFSLGFLFPLGLSFLKTHIY